VLRHVRREQDIIRHCGVNTYSKRGYVGRNSSWHAGHGRESVGTRSEERVHVRARLDVYSPRGKGGGEMVGARKGAFVWRSNAGVYVRVPEREYDWRTRAHHRVQ
jgi:hypothetical protein